jgi:hypothetical protein
VEGFCYIGSVGLKHALPVQFKRPQTDIDAIADFESAKRFLKKMECRLMYPINQGKTLIGKNDVMIYEMSIAWPGSLNEELLKYLDGATTAPLDVLYTLKMSHRFLRNSPHFYKTMDDIRLMREHGAKIPDDLKNWFKRREKETYDYKHPSLDQNKNNFFSGDGVNYIYDHDSLHRAVAVYDEPMYYRYQRQGSEVACDRAKWDALSDYDKATAVYEEACVLGLERSLIPFPGKWSELHAFEYALMKICTSITSGWFREWAWENHARVLEEYKDNPSYLERFERGLKNGVVIKHE